jgi:hypothetical protein
MKWSLKFIGPIKPNKETNRKHIHSGSYKLCNQVGRGKGTQNQSLQGILSIPTHTFVTCVQINHFFYYWCDYPPWHHGKTTCSCKNNQKVVCSCICNYDLWLMSVWMKVMMKSGHISSFLMAFQNRWKCGYICKLGCGS